jgi:hypothetical protein
MTPEGFIDPNLNGISNRPILWFGIAPKEMKDVVAEECNGTYLKRWWYAIYADKSFRLFFCLALDHGDRWTDTPLGFKC